MKNLGKNGLSMSQAQSISNLCNQRAIEIDNTVDNFNVIAKTLTIDGEIYEKVEAKPISDNIIDLIMEKAKYNGQQEQPHLGHIVMPEKKYIDTPEYKDTVTEDWGWQQLSVKEMAEYLDVEAQAAQVGKFIHKRGKLSQLRHQLAQFSPLEFTDIYGDRKTPVKVTKHHSAEELHGMHEAFAKIHRECNQRVNYFKAKVKNLISAENEKIHRENAVLKSRYEAEVQANNAEYSMAIEEYRNTKDVFVTEFYADRESRLNEASKKRINVDPRFQEVIDSLMA
jgi:hypothetical protein